MSAPTEPVPQVVCDDRSRRPLLLADHTWNGIDAIEVPWDDQEHLRVYFVNSPPPALTVAQLHIEGGVRVRNIAVTGVAAKTDANGDHYLEVTVDRAGDFSIYTLVADAPGNIDPAFARRLFSFKAGCPTDLDCEVEEPCPVDPVDAPAIDYLAKDYESFRRLMLDRISATVPQWRERHDADLGMALVQLLAYVGDDLSYYQDAVANEAFLETARQRESVRRHTKLIDYPMHDGASARAFVHFTVSAAGVVRQRTAVLARIDSAVEEGSVAPPGPVILAQDGERASGATTAVFEVMADTPVDPALNGVAIHTWGDAQCCLPRGATTVDLVGDVPVGSGDLLLLEEVLGPETGLPQDADRTHRHVVRLAGVDRTVRDPLMTLHDGEAVSRSSGDPELNVTRVWWSGADRLPFPLCLSAILPEGTSLPGVSVARGNLALADHGRTVSETYPDDGSAVAGGNTAFRFRLQQGPLSFRPVQGAIPGDPPPADAVRSLMALSPRGAEPQVTRLTVNTPAGAIPMWSSVPDLLDSDPFGREFVVEIGNDGRATIRFGDDEFGMAPPDGSTIDVTYRVGVGRGGNAGSDSLAHVVVPDPTPPNWPDVDGVRNPLPAWGGLDPESLDQVKRMAPAAFHSELYRAVTEDDFARAAEKLPEVQRAAARFRWTGSWYTVFVAVDPAGTDELTPDLGGRIAAFLTRYRQAGYDLEITPPVYVPLEVAVEVCVAADHFRGDVKRAVLEALDATVHPDGGLGFFAPDNFTFGQSVYLSRLYAALESIPGVDSARVAVFKRFGMVPAGELDAGRIEMAPLEIARLDNDPSAPENGTLTLSMLGGK